MAQNKKFKIIKFELRINFLSEPQTPTLLATTFKKIKKIILLTISPHWHPTFRNLTAPLPVLTPDLNLESPPYTVQPRRLYRHHYCLDPDGKFTKFFIP
jgi:hypothetical protein